MMNNIKKMNTIYWAFAVLVALIFSSCSDWRELESVTINESDVARENPALYARYLESLRAYKEADHKVVMAWFDNANKTPLSRADHLTVLPDSIDIVSLLHPDTLSQQEMEEMQKVRSEKGTRFVFDLDFTAIRSAYNDLAANWEVGAIAGEKEVDAPEGETDEGEGESAPLPSFVEFLTDTVSRILPLVTKYNYDGIVVNYPGKSIAHMSEDEKQVHLLYEKAFMGIALDWMERNGDKMVLFEGYPQNVIDKGILEKCRYIIIPCMDSANSADLTYNLLWASMDGVPGDRFIVAVECTSRDKVDTKTGYWSDGTTRAVTGTSLWLSSVHNGFTVNGMGIKNVNNDYFDITRVYSHTRDAISMINPSPNN